MEMTLEHPARKAVEALRTELLGLIGWGKDKKKTASAVLLLPGRIVEVEDVFWIGPRLLRVGGVIARSGADEGTVVTALVPVEQALFTVMGRELKDGEVVPMLATLNDGFIFTGDRERIAILVEEANKQANESPPTGGD